MSFGTLSCSGRSAATGVRACCCRFPWRCNAMRSSSRTIWSTSSLRALPCPALLYSALLSSALKKGLGLLEGQIDQRRTRALSHRSPFLPHSPLNSLRLADAIKLEKSISKVAGEKATATRKATASGRTGGVSPLKNISLHGFGSSAVASTVEDIAELFMMPWQAQRDGAPCEFSAILREEERSDGRARLLLSDALDLSLEHAPRQAGE